MDSNSAEHRLERLSRADKACLSAGEGILFAPGHPQWLHTPGFWDYVTVLQARCEPGFSVALVNALGLEIGLTQTGRHWRPDRLVAEYRAATGHRLTETRLALSGGRFVSRWDLAPADADSDSGGEGGEAGDPLAGAWLVAFTAQPAAQTRAASLGEMDRSVRWTRELTERHHGTSLVHLELAAVTGGPESVGAVVACGQRSEGTAVHPRYDLTPLMEMWSGRDGSGGGVVGPRPGLKLEGLPPGPRDIDYFAVATPFSGDSAIAFVMAFTPDCRASVIRPGFATSSGRGVARTQAPAGAGPGHDVLTSEDAGGWRTFFNHLPQLSCDDPFVQNYFDYRWFGLRLCHIDGGYGNQHYPAVAEGIDYFHEPITYSGYCHMFETRWSASPATARGSLLNFLDHQREDGSIHGRIYAHELVKTDFYHANWGDGLLAVHAVHPDRGYLESVYDRLSRYADWLLHERDAEDTGLIDVVNHFETGQEFMSRYQVVNARADEDLWKNTTRLKAIDVSVYAYQLRRALAWTARRLGLAASMAQDHDRRADRIARAITDLAWDRASGIFSDINPADGQRTGVRAAVCFYPMLTDLLTDGHVDRLLEHLTDPGTFATPWPLPAAAVDDPYFDAEARWKGKRHNCPWNGRTWPMTTCHVIDGLIRQWRRRPAGCDPQHPRYRCGVLASQWLQRFIRLMHFPTPRGLPDLRRPNCFEHYNPFTGQACIYRGIDDYQHSYVNDLFVRGLLGLDVSEDIDGSARIAIDPLPPADPWRAEADAGPIRRVGVQGLPLRGRLLDVHVEEGSVRARAGEHSWSGRLGEPLMLDWPAGA